MTPITRLHYRERQRLRTADLADEQLYLVQARRRHNITHHRWGIVWGLALTQITQTIDDKEKKMYFVQPGVAIDGYGRELIVPVALQITSEMTEALGEEWGHNPDRIDLWLVYNEVTYTPPQRGRVEICYDSRISEQTCLRFTEGADIEKVTTADRRKPDVVPEENQDFQPWQTPPDDWMNPWPVYLGQLKYEENQYQPDMNNRPYAELIGERVTTPSGQGWMELKDDGGIVRRFSINLLDDKAVMTKRLDVQYSESTRETQATIWGNLIIKGDLSVGGKPKPKPLFPVYARGLHFDTPRVTPEKAAPWQFYRTQFKPKDAPPETKPIDQLRLEIFDPGQEGDETAYGFSIGHWDTAKDQYQSCLRLTADCSVELSGTLNVIGEIQQAPIPADPNDPRFAEAMLAMWLNGISKASGILDTQYSGNTLGRSLALEITFNFDHTAPYRIGLDIGYTITLKNIGMTRLGTIQVTSNVTYPSNIPPSSPAAVGQTIPFIDPGSTSSVIRGTITRPTHPGQLLIAVIASAVTPDGKVVISTVMKSIPITQ